MAYILVVEDDADVQAVVIEFLQATGIALLCAASAEEARPFLASEPSISHWSTA